MNIMRIMGAACFTVAIWGTAFAAVSQQEADQLGGSVLTEFGAERAGNASGTIPPYTGGLPVDTAPAGWKKGSGRYDVTPYDDEKPVLSINSGNVDKYADHLTAGVIALIKRFPDYRIDVYPTHRSISYPTKWLAHCKENATTVKLTETGNGISGGHSCLPFPIPKNGLEVQWNVQLRYAYGVSSSARFSNWLRDASGHINDLGHLVLDTYHTWADPARETMSDNFIDHERIDWLGPPSQVGTKILLYYSSDYEKDDQMAWAYSPGQRRVRLAPEFAYDTPVAQYGGAVFYDEQSGLEGKPDRFDWTLVGKKEMYVPYNSYKLLYTPVDKLFDNHGFVNPDVYRWELHRVWVVEAKLKAGKRHVYSRRTFYVDEDSWAVLASDSYDQGGKLYRAGFIPQMPIWDHHTFAQSMNFYDLTKGVVLMGPAYSRSEDRLLVRDQAPEDLSSFTADGMAGAGIR